MFGHRRKTKQPIAEPVLRQRADCPHLPHDSPCGAVHDGPCVVVHKEACEATHPICPACHTDAFRVHVPAIVIGVRQDGVIIGSCSTCEQRSFRYDADLICPTCDWLVPDVNDRLAERFEANGGPFAAKPGECSGCGQRGAGPPISFPVTCPKCGSADRIPQEVVNTKGGVTARCANDKCGFGITIPASIWCPDCKLNLRTLSKITELIAEANSTDLMVLDNVKESGLDRLARILVTLVNVHDRWCGRLTAEQRRQLIDTRHLDALLFGDKPVEEWIHGQVELRAIGHQLDRDGGNDLMQKVAKRASELSETPVLGIINATWDGIGNWLA